MSERGMVLAAVPWAERESRCPANPGRVLHAPVHDIEISVVMIDGIRTAAVHNIVALDIDIWGKKKTSAILLSIYVFAISKYAQGFSPRFLLPR